MESYYDTIPNFRYWDIEAWKNYLKEYIAPIYKTTATLLELRDELLPYVGKSLKAVKDNDEKLLPFFVGGIDENGNYKERSLAKLIKLMFGIYVEPREFASIIKSVGEEGLKDIKMKAKEEREVSFLRMIKELNKFSDEVLQKAEIEVQHTLGIGSILQNPDKLLDILKEFYKACVSFSANHNYYTFFIISTANIHWKYLVTAYPKLKENFEKLKDFLGLEPIFVPNVGSDELKKNYTIWGHEKEGITRGIHKMQVKIWEVFPAKDVFEYAISEPENLKGEYKNLVEMALRDVEEYKENLDIGDTEFNPREEYWLKINGLFIEKWPKIRTIVDYFVALENNLSPSYFRRTYERPYEDEMSKPKIPLTEFLDGVAPLLFLGLARIQTTKRELQEIREKYNEKYMEDYYQKKYYYKFEACSSSYDLIYIGNVLDTPYWWL